MITLGLAAVVDHLLAGGSGTVTPDDLPSPDEFRKKMAHVDQEFADARRYLSALCAEDIRRSVR